jgi:carotenoid cleavage dioxygenase-like enzyme
MHAAHRVSGSVPRHQPDLILLSLTPLQFFEPRLSYHWFDGDGMLHAVRLKGGKAWYSNQWVETSRLKQERQYGWAVFTKLGDMTGLYGLVLVRG